MNYRPDFYFEASSYLKNLCVEFQRVFERKVLKYSILNHEIQSNADAKRVFVTYYALVNNLL